MSAEHSTNLEYRDIPGFPGYRIGSDGTVWSRLHHGGNNKAREAIGRGRYSDTWRQLKVNHGKSGKWYASISLKSPEGIKCSFILHTLMLTIFVGPCPDGMEGCHGDGNKEHNWLDNLRWDTPKGNRHDAALHGTIPRGSKHANAKITESIVVDVLASVESGESRLSVARRIGLSWQQVNRIVKGECWAHVPRLTVELAK